VDKTDTEKQINTKTLGGWLIAVQVFLIMNAISWVRNLQMYYELFGKKDELIKEKGISDPGIYTAFIYYELAASLLFAFGAFISFWYFFKRNSYFPLIMTIYLIAEVVVEGVSFLAFGSLADDQSLLWEKFGFTALIAVSFIIYLRRSKRVKQTFIF